MSPGTSPAISNSLIIPSFLSLLPAYGLRYDLSVSASCSSHHAYLPVAMLALACDGDGTSGLHLSSTTTIYLFTKLRRT